MGFIVLMGGLAACPLLSGVTGIDQGAAQANAETWAGQSYPDMKASANCVRQDTDGDGYVSCTVVVFKKGGDPMPPVQVECAGSLTLNAGCRVPKAVVRTGR